MSWAQKRNSEDRLQERYVERRLSVSWQLGDDLDKGHHGPRRAGKSFFAVHLIQQAGSYGYVNFDDERLTAAADLDEIVSAINDVYGNPRCLLLDEIQNLPNWELFVNRLQGRGSGCSLPVVTPTCSVLELATHLTGRHTVHALLLFRRIPGGVGQCACRPDVWRKWH